MESCFANQIPLELEVVLPPLAPSGVAALALQVCVITPFFNVKFS